MLADEAVPIPAPSSGPLLRFSAGLLLSAAILLPGAVHAQEIVGHVYASRSGEAVQGAEVLVKGLDAVAVTNQAGLFRIDDVPPGEYTVRVRYLGMESRELEVSLGYGETANLSVGLEVAVIPMPEIYATVSSAIPVNKLYEFYKRKQTSMGHFITREEIAKHPGARPTAVLRQVPGLDIGPTRYGNASVTMGRREDCVPLYFIDGARAPGFNINNLQMNDIAGIEVYRGHAEIPLQFSIRARCGVIVLWTRDPSNASSFQ